MRGNGKREGLLVRKRFEDKFFVKCPIIKNKGDSFGVVNGVNSHENHLIRFFTRDDIIAAPTKVIHAELLVITIVESIVAELLFTVHLEIPQL